MFEHCDFEDLEAAFGENPSPEEVKHQESLRSGFRLRPVCKDCARMPKDEREAIEQKDELFGYLKQSNISAKNIARLKILSVSPNPQIAELAGIVLKVAEVKPHKRGRLKVLARERRDLLEDLERTGLILAHHW